MKRLKLVANKTQLSDEVMKSIKNIYVESCKEFMKNSPELNKVDPVDRDDCVEFIGEYCFDNYRSIDEFNFLFEPIMNIITETAKTAVENADDIMVEQYLDSKNE